MTRTLLIQAAAILALALSANQILSQTATPAATTMLFNPASVGVSAGSAQTLTASFLVSGYSGTFTPTAKLHYGLSYTAGAVNCTGGSSPETCTVAITFQPQYPGGRREALFLMNSTTRLATVLIYGIGQAPFALVQPGVVTNPILNNTNYLYQSIVDENGTAYVLGDNSNTIYSVTKAGVVSTLPITGLNSPRGIGIDGAGVLYIADQTFNGPTITWDTVQNLRGTIPFAAPNIYVQSITVGNTGNIYETDAVNVYTVPIVGLGTASTKAISPAITQAYIMAVDSNENVFLGGYEINEITSGGVQTQINIIGAGDGLGVDAADTLYATRYTGTGGDAELPASGYGTLEAALDVTSSPLGTSVGPDGTVYIGNYVNLDKVDRSQGAVAFGQVSTAATQNISIYNGGNQPLTITNIAIAGAGFTTQTATTNPCTLNVAIAPGAICQVAVTLTPPHAGTFSGTLIFTDNSLNSATSTQTAALSGAEYGVYVTPSPTSLTFPNQILNTTSTAQTVSLTNSGELYTASIGLPSPGNTSFSAGLGTCTAGIAPGASCNINVTFSPQAVTSYNNVIVSVPYLSSGGGTAPPPATFTVSGTGIAAPPAVTFAPTSIAFGDQVINTTSSPTQVVVLTNSGTASLTGIAISITGAPASFGQTNNCPTTLTVGASCSISINFTPTATVGYTANLSVADNVTGSPQTVPLTGTGISFVSNVGTPLSAQLVNLYFPVGGTVNSIQVLTQGAPGLDFTSSTGGSCATGTAYTTGQYCTVNVVFTPKFAGARAGAVLLTDSSGNALATSYLPGTGLGPQIVFSPGTSTTVPVSGLQQPFGIAVDASDNVYIPDRLNDRVVKVPRTGSTYGTQTVVPITGLSNPWDMTVDGAGNLYIADSTNHRVVKVPWTGSAYSTQTIVPTTNLIYPQGIAVDGNGNLYMTEQTGNTLSSNIVKVPWTGSGYGTQTTVGTGVGDPVGIKVDSSGNVLVVDADANSVVKIAWNGTTYGAQTTVPTTGLSVPSGLALDGSGDVYIADTTNGRVVKVAWNGTTYGAQTTVATGLDSASGVAVDGSGNVFIDNSYADQVIEVDVADPPSLSFAATNVGSISTDSPKTVTVQNIGNASFAFTVPSTGTNPSYPTNFLVNISDSSLCASGTSLAEGATCDVSVNFKPTTSGSLTGNVVLTDNQLNMPGATQSIAVSGTGNSAPAPVAVLTPSPLAFPSTAVGLTATALPVTLSNTGNASLTGIAVSITGANPSDFAITSSTTCGTTLAAGTSCLIYVSFTPASATSFSATLSVADNASGSPQTVTLTGSGTAAPVAGLSPNPLAFPNTTVASTAAALPVTLSNTGNATLTGIVISITGTNPSDFATTSATTCGTTLAAGTSCLVDISFTPASATSFSATLSVADNASGSPQTVTLTGTGTTAPTPQAALTPNPLAFPGTLIGTGATALPMTLSNAGTAALTITSISVIGTNSSSFGESNNCGTSLAAGANCTITVTFTPASAGSLGASISVVDNATGSPHTAAVTGTGTAPQATFTSSTLTFPGTLVGTSATTQSTTLSNPGTAALTITGISVTGTNASSFAQTNTCGTSLAAGANCTITVTFTPASAGSLGASISVADNAAGSPQTVTLTGTGTAPQAVLSPNPLAFPSTLVGTAATALPMTLSNPGTAALVITSISVTGANASSFGQTNTCGATLAAGATCTITVTFTPASAATLTAAISVADNAAGSPQSAALTGTGTAPLVPQAVLSPNSLAFPSTTINTSATPLPMTLSNPGNATLTITSISVTGTNASSFSQTNTCGATLAAGATCTITVTFTPATAASFAAAISVADNASGSPQSAAITGTGSAGTFVVASSTPSGSVQPGAVAQFNILVNPLGGSYNNLVTLSATGLPAGATVSFLPAAVTPGTAGAPSVMSIQTPSGLARLAIPKSQRRTGAPLFALLTGLPLLGLVAKRRRFRSASRRWMLLALATLAILPALAVSGCGGGYFGPTPQTYTVTVTGTSGALQESTTITLTVQ